MHYMFYTENTTCTTKYNSKQKETMLKDITIYFFFHVFLFSFFFMFFFFPDKDNEIKDNQTGREFLLNVHSLITLMKKKTNLQKIQFSNTWV